MTLWPIFGPWLPFWAFTRMKSYNWNFPSSIKDLYRTCHMCSTALVSQFHLTLPVTNYVCNTSLLSNYFCKTDRIISDWTAPVSSCYPCDWIWYNKYIFWHDLHVKHGSTSKCTISSTTAITKADNNFGPIHYFQSRNLLKCHLLTGKEVHLISYCLYHPYGAILDLYWH